MKRIAIIGAGSWGLALALLLNEKGHEVIVWCHSEQEKELILTYKENKRCLPGIKIPMEIQFSTSLQDVLGNREMAIIAVPSKAVREISKQVSLWLEEQTLLVCVSKGLEKNTGLRLSQVIEQEINYPVVVLSGPSHAEEVARHMPTTLVAACKETILAEKVQQICTTPTLRVYTNKDIVGVELGGALKNSIAIAAGILEGLGYGDNTKAALITRGIAEIARLGLAMGAETTTFWGLTGIGDLVVTCTSGHSRNRRFGELLGQGYSSNEAMQRIHMVVEGLPATQIAYQLMQQYKVEMPIVTTIYQVLFEEKEVKDAVIELMGRNLKYENA